MHDGSAGYVIGDYVRVRSVERSGIRFMDDIGRCVSRFGRVKNVVAEGRALLLVGADPADPREEWWIDHQDLERATEEDYLAQQMLEELGR
jgi:hypothetical protein